MSTVEKGVDRREDWIKNRERTGEKAKRKLEIWTKMRSSMSSCSREGREIDTASHTRRHA